MLKSIICVLALNTILCDVIHYHYHGGMGAKNPENMTEEERALFWNTIKNFFKKPNCKRKCLNEFCTNKEKSAVYNAFDFSCKGEGDDEKTYERCKDLCDENPDHKAKDTPRV